MSRTIPLSEAKARLSSIINDVLETHEIFTISKDGVPVAVLMSIEEYESLLETVEILSEPELMQALQESSRDKEAGRILTHEEVWHNL